MKKVRKSKGFTLAELIIVTAIIGILLAVAIPNVISYYRSLKLTELDDSARSIFVAAQNRLTAMKNAGENLNALCSGTKSAMLEGGGTVNVSTVTDQKKLDALVLSGSIDPQLHENHYVVEINPETGAVFAVWYWESDSAFKYDDAYDPVKPEKKDRLEEGHMVGYYGGVGIDRLPFKQMPFPSVKVINGEELRVQIIVPAMSSTYPGYTDNDVLVDVFINGVKIVDGANLWPSHSTTNPTSPLEPIGTVVLDTLNSSTCLSNFNESLGKPNDGSQSWTYGMQYKQWASKYTGSTFPAPGEELTVTVKLRYNGTVNIGGADTGLTPQTVTVQCNSLFESAEEIMDATGAGTGNYTAHIAYGRHLQNLDTAISGVTSSVTEAVQTRDINFHQTGTDTIKFWASTYPDSSTYSGGMTFTPINNVNLTSYDGGEKLISDLDVNVSDPGGLFGTTSASFTTLKDTNLVDAHVEGSTVGALAGSVQGDLEISGCHVWLTDPVDHTSPTVRPKDPYVSGTGYVGGLVGTVGTGATVTISESFASTIENSTSDVGGLVGYVNGTLNIEKSYAAGYLSGDAAVGGLVGGADSTGTLNITNSYAAGIIAEGTTVAGLTSANATEITNSYAAVRYSEAIATASAATPATVTVYGAALTGATVDHTYYLKQAGVTYAAGVGQTKNINELRGMVAGGFGAALANWSTGPNMPGDSHAYGQTSKTAELRTQTYPYPMLMADGSVLPHYGDWLWENIVVSSLCYYERYPVGMLSSGEYGLWGYIDTDPTAAGTTLQHVNSLLDGTPTAGYAPASRYAVDDGYCVPVKPDEQVPTSITVDGVEYGLVMLEHGVEVRVNGVTETYDLYGIDGLVSGPKALDQSGQYYHTVKLGTEDFWLNPFYACEVVRPESGVDVKDAKPQPKEGAGGQGSANPAGNYGGKVIIRTARQLANMAAATGSAGDADNAAQLRDYEQLLDIDYNAYTGLNNAFTTGKDDAHAQTPAALWGVSGGATGSYDGHEHTISNLHIKPEDGTTEKVGLFGELGTGNETAGAETGLIQNITLIDVKVAGTGYNRVGALAGNVARFTIIRSCGVFASSASAYSSYTIEGGQYVGGLVGVLGSNTKVKNSFATVKVTGTNYVGGFAGQINGSAGLGNCYSGGRTDGTNEANVTATNGSAGGFAGKITNFSGSGASASPRSFVIEPGVLYSTCSVAGKTKTVGGVLTGIGLFAGEVAEYFDSSRPTASPDVSQGQHIIAEALSESGVTDYALGSSYTYGTSGNTKTAPHAETYLKTNLADILAKGNDTKASPYDTDLVSNSKSFPYLTAGDGAGGYAEHHGDWPEMTEAVFYWEQEGAANYNFYAKVLIGDNMFSYDTLCKEHHTDTSGHRIQDWGYGTFSTGTAPTMSNGSPDTNASDVQTDFASKILSKFGLTTANYNMYDQSSSNSGTATGGKNTYYIDLRFAAAVEVGSTSTFGSDTNPFEIRAASQLEHVDNSGSYFEQTHDVVYSTSAPHTASITFNGHYDGGYFRILNIGAPLFNQLSSAELSNIVLYSTGSNTITGTGSVGGIASEVSGTATITNCAVAGYTISGSSNVGGLVGTTTSGASLTISSCEAVNTLAGNASTSNVGGLVGSASGTVTINSSYAGMSISSGVTGAASSLNSIGGLVGSGSCTYTNVYSYVDMTGVTATNVYGIGPGASADCYYLTGKLPSGATTTDGAPKTSEELKSCMKDGGGNYIGGFGEAVNTYPTTSTLTGPYPYPAVVKDHEGQFVHYGDWQT